MEHEDINDGDTALDSSTRIKRMFELITDLLCLRV
jgi:hypothetical protein